MDNSMSLLGYADDETTEVDSQATQSADDNKTTDSPSGDQPASQDTPTDKAGTPADDKSGDSGDPLARFGLSGQYHSVEDALAAVRHKEQRIKDLEYQVAMAARKKAEETPAPLPQLSRDEIAEALLKGEVDVLKRVGYMDEQTVRKVVAAETAELRQQFEARQVAIETAGVYDSYPELRDVGTAYRRGQTPQTGVNPVYDAMNRVLVESPGLLNAYRSGALAEADLIPILYRTDTVQAVVAQKRNGKTAPTNVADKSSLQTSNGSGRPTLDFLKAEDFQRMTPEQIEKYYREKGLYKGF